MEVRVEGVGQDSPVTSPGLEIIAEDHHLLSVRSSEEEEEKRRVGKKREMRGDDFLHYGKSGR